MEVTLRGHHRDTFRLAPVNSLTDGSTYLYLPIDYDGTFVVNLDLTAWKVWVRPQGGVLFHLASVEIPEDLFYFRILNPFIDSEGILDLTPTADQTIISIIGDDYYGTWPYVKQQNGIKIHVTQDKLYFGGPSGPTGGATAPTLAVFDNDGATTGMLIEGPVAGAPTGGPWEYFITTDGLDFGSGQLYESDDVNDDYFISVETITDDLLVFPSDNFLIDSTDPEIQENGISLASAFSIGATSTSTPSVILLMAGNSVTDTISGPSRVIAQPFIGATGSYYGASGALAAEDQIDVPLLVAWGAHNNSDYSFLSNFPAFHIVVSHPSLGTGTCTIGSEPTEESNSSFLRFRCIESNILGGGTATNEPVDVYVMPRGTTDSEIIYWTYNLPYVAGQAYNVQLDLGLPVWWMSIYGAHYGMVSVAQDKALNNSSATDLALYQSLSFDPYGLFPPGIAWEFLDSFNGSVVYVNENGWYTDKELWIHIFMVDVAAGAPAAYIEYNADPIASPSSWSIINVAPGSDAQYQFNVQGVKSFYVRTTNTEGLSSNPFLISYKWDNVPPTLEGEDCPNDEYLNCAPSLGSPVEGFGSIYFTWGSLSIADGDPVNAGSSGVGSGVDTFTLYRNTSLPNMQASSSSPFNLLYENLETDDTWILPNDKVLWHPDANGTLVAILTDSSGGTCGISSSDTFTTRIDISGCTAGGTTHPLAGTTYTISAENPAIFVDSEPTSLVEVAEIPITQEEFTDTSFPTSAFSTGYYYWMRVTDRAGLTGAGEYDNPLPYLLVNDDAVYTVPLVPADVDGQLQVVTVGPSIEENATNHGWDMYAITTHYGVSVPVGTASLSTQPIYNRGNYFEKLKALEGLQYKDGEVWVNVYNPKVNGEPVSFGYVEDNVSYGAGVSGPISLQADQTNLLSISGNNVSSWDYFGFTEQTVTTIKFTVDDEGTCVQLPGSVLACGTFPSEDSCGVAASYCEWISDVYFHDTFIESINNSTGKMQIEPPFSGYTLGDINVHQVGLLLESNTVKTLSFNPVDQKYWWRFLVAGNPVADCSGGTFTDEAGCTNDGETWLNDEALIDDFKFNTFLAADLIVGGVLRLETGLSVWSGGYTGGQQYGSGIILDQFGLQMFDAIGDTVVEIKAGAEVGDGGSFKFGSPTSNLSFDPEAGSLILVGTFTQVMPDPAIYNDYPLTQYGPWNFTTANTNSGYPPGAIVQWMGGCETSGATSEGACSGDWHNGDGNYYSNSDGGGDWASNTEVPPNYPWELFATSEPQIAKTLSIHSSSQLFVVPNGATNFAVPAYSKITVDTQGVTPQSGNWEITATGYTGDGQQGFNIPLFASAISPSFSCSGGTCTDLSSGSTQKYTYGTTAYLHSMAMVMGVSDNGVDYVDNGPERFEYVECSISVINTVDGATYEDTATSILADDGSDSYSVILSNEHHLVQTDSDGYTDGDWSGAFTYVSLYQGAELIDTTFIDIADFGPTVDPETGAIVAIGGGDQIQLSMNSSESPRLEVDLTGQLYHGITDIFVDIDVYGSTAEYNGGISKIVTKRFKVAKAIKGQPGNDIQALILTTSSNFYIFEGNFNTPDPGTQIIEFSAGRQNIGTFNIGWRIKYYTDQYHYLNNTHAVWGSNQPTGPTAEISVANYVDEIEGALGVEQFIVQVWDVGAGSETYDSSLYKDQVTINKLASGSETYNIILSNDFFIENTVVSNIGEVTAEIELYTYLGTTLVTDDTVVGFTASAGVEVDYYDGGAWTTFTGIAPTGATGFRVKLDVENNNGNVEFTPTHYPTGSSGIEVGNKQFDIARVLDGEVAHAFSLSPENSIIVFDELNNAINSNILVDAQTSLLTDSEDDINWYILSPTGATLDSATGGITGTYIEFTATDKITVAGGTVFSDHTTVRAEKFLKFMPNIRLPQG